MTAISQPRAATSILLVGGFLLAAVVLGAVVATGNPVYIGLVAGAIVGIALLNALPVVLWLLIVGVLLVNGPLVMSFPGLAKTAWLYSVLGFFLAGAAVLHSAIGRERFARPAPRFVPIMVGIIAVSALLLPLSAGDISEGVGAIKRHYQMWGLMFILAVVPFTWKLVRSWARFAVGLAMLQLPFAIYQFVVLVPIREKMMWYVPGLAPIDVVAGTLENRMDGGGANPEMALLLVIVITMLLSAYREGMIRGWLTLLMTLIAAAPLAIGEVKLVIVTLPLALWIVSSDLIRARPALFAVGALMVAAATAALAVVIALVVTPPDRKSLTVEQRIELLWKTTVGYNFGDDSYSGSAIGLNRTSAIAFWYQEHGLQNPVETVLGHGLGSAHAGETKSASGHMDAKFHGKAIGMSTLSALLWEIGLLGVAAYALVFGGALAVARRLARDATSGADRVLCKTLLTACAIVTLMIPYSMGLLSVLSHQLVAALTLGLIAWRWRRGAAPG